MRFFRFDSLDGLRHSIAAHLGRDRRAGASSLGDLVDEMAPVIDRLLLAEARRNERWIACLRACLAGVYILIAMSGRLTAGAVGGPSTATVVLLVVWGAASAALFVTLRRDWYPTLLRKLIPIGDATAIVIGSWLAATRVPVRESATAFDPHAALAANVALLCAFLVVTGALRLTADSAALSSGLAGAAFVSTAFGVLDLPVLSAVAIFAGLCALSGLTWLMTDAMRRVITTEAHRMTMERQVERARARAAEAQAAGAAREEVLRIVAHDLRNPLGTLLMAADLLGEPTLPNESRAKYAGVVKRTGSRMNHLIRDLLDVARMDRGRLAIEPQAVAPEKILANAVELMQPLALDKSLKLIDARAGSQDPLPLVSADVERIGQVFSNLIGNAIKFTLAGGTVTLGADVADGKVWFSVTDTGPGIPPEQLERVFGEFWQARKADSRGIGLGLTIAKGIVEAHGGTIGVSSEVGVGTRFWFGLRHEQQVRDRQRPQ